MDASRLVEARDSMQAARAAMLANLETFVAHVETFPDGPVKTALCEITLGVVQWGKSMGEAVEAINTLIAGVESAADFAPGVSVLTDPNRRQN